MILFTNQLQENLDLGELTSRDPDFLNSFTCLLKECSENLELNASFRIVRKFGRTMNRKFYFFWNFFQILMIRLDRIKLATYPSRPLDPMDFKAKSF